MIIEQLPVFFRGVYRKVTWRKNSRLKNIYLTFDDGPIPEVTPWVLDTLDTYGVKATFFCVGENVWRYPELYQEILRRGHRTGNHTYNHLRGFFTSTKRYLENVEKAAGFVQSNLFRPPHGELRSLQYLRLRSKYQIIQWDVITRDYNPDLTGEQVLGIVKKYARNGSIVVFHDSLKAQRNMRHAMPKAIEYLLAQGYSFEML
jgi:peptidoglycan/xylan/chitin deacetylase (PgdA/CDA1 family)